MWIVLSCIVIGGIVGVILGRNIGRPNTPPDIGNTISGGVFGVLLGAVASLVVTVVIGSFLARPVWVRTNVTELVSLRSDDHQIKGTFFLGSGSIGDNTWYFYYAKVGGGYQPKKLVADEKVTIFEDNTKNPSLVQFTKCDHGRFNNRLYFYPIFTDEYKYEFHIPPGAIRRNFILN